MAVDFIRDHAMYAAIFGLFSFVWFGWAQERPPASWRIGLGAGSLAGLIVASIGVYLAVRYWGDASALRAPGAYYWFGATVATELLLGGLGALILSRRRRQRLIVCWVAFVVGIHFVPLAIIFEDGWLNVLAGLAMLVAIASPVVAKRTTISVSALTGVSMGILLLAFALRGLFLVWW